MQDSSALLCLPPLRRSLPALSRSGLSTMRIPMWLGLRWPIRRCSLPGRLLMQSGIRILLLSWRDIPFRELWNGWGEYLSTVCYACSFIWNIKSNSIRYSLFTILYPIGIGSEWWLMFKATKVTENMPVAALFAFFLGLYAPGKWYFHSIIPGFKLISCRLGDDVFLHAQTKG
jgi:hypothetical protein